jgi:hypothetical protein
MATTGGEERLDHLVAEVASRKASLVEPRAQLGHQAHRRPDRVGQVALGAKDLLHPDCEAS